PFNEVCAHEGARAKTRDLTGLARTEHRADEYRRELHSSEAFPDHGGLVSSDLGQGNIGEGRVPSFAAPFRLPMANDHELDAPRCDARRHYPDTTTIAWVFAGGDAPSGALRRRVGTDGYVIAADSGVEHAIRLAPRVDLVVGDLDSAAPDAIEHAVALGATVQ